MKPRLKHHLMAALLGVVFTAELDAQTTAFTYQGQLTENGAPYSGSAEFQFTLWDAASGGTAVATNDPPQIVAPVSDGLFTLELDFGDGVFDGSERFLQIEVRTSIGSFTALTPRQAITPAPQAIHATTAASATTVDMGMISNPTFIGTTITNAPLEFFVNNQRALRIEDNGDSSDSDLEPDGAPNVIGGAPVNSVAEGVVGATIAGGGAANSGGFAYSNTVSADFAMIGGGRNITIDPGAEEAVIVGGIRNRVGMDASGSFIGGGRLNEIETRASRAVIAGGAQNIIQSDAVRSFIGGGFNNTISTNADESTIGGGIQNTIESDSTAATIGGGTTSTIGSGAVVSTIGGGSSHTIESGASGATISGGSQNFIGFDADHATIPGGLQNVAGARGSFAAGFRAHADHRGSFVWADDGLFEFHSVADNEFAVRAANGVRIANSGDGATLLRLETERPWEFRQRSTGSATALELVSLDSSGVANKNFIINTTGGGSVGIGTTSPGYKLHVNGSVAGVGSYNNLSDRRYKKDVQPLTNALDTIAQLEGITFDWRREEHPEMQFEQGRQLGFIAQDLQAVVPEAVSESEDGTLHAAYAQIIPLLVEAIKEQNQKAKVSIRSLEAKNAELKQRLEKLERLLNATINGGQQ